MNSNIFNIDNPTNNKGYFHAEIYIINNDSNSTSFGQ